MDSTARSRQLSDRAAAWVVRIGGIAIIASILGILLFLGVEVLPFLHHAEVRRTADPPRTLPFAPAAILLDETRSLLVGVDRDGWLRGVDLKSGAVVEERRLLETPLEEVHADPRARSFVLGSTTGTVVRAAVKFRVDFQGEGETLERHVTLEVEDTERCEFGEGDGGWRAFAAKGGADSSLFLAQDGQGVLHVVSVREETDFLTDEVQRVEERHEAPAGVPVDRLFVDADQRNVYAASAKGSVLWWSVSDGTPTFRQELDLEAGPITASELLLGDQCLLLGTQSGGIHGVFLARGASDELHLVAARHLEPVQSAVESFVVSERGRSFLSLDRGGGLALHHATSQERRFTGSYREEGSEGRGSPVPAVAMLSPKGEALYVAEDRSLRVFEVDDPHPEITLGTLFGKVWYENYSEPEYVWQSSGGSVGTEPKFSLVPLLFGTIKGTLFALLIAIPLGVLGAIYTSQYLHPSLRRFLKPTVEIMASLPSVVLGFLAGLWLAPHVEAVFPGLVLSFLLLPAFLILSGWSWQKLPLSFRGRFPAGTELLVFCVATLAALWLSFGLNSLFEAQVFGGDYRAWFYERMGLGYDQRNAVIVGLAMGFAVIPILFAISEDALSNVPRHLISGSLAMGATRWQTVVRVVLPTASPGIFSAIIIGFGRAIGETMIVLMGSGNTPVMDWNPFNGMRTLSANIAVEISEAPEHGTLYRTLFLAALLLFLVTFLLNTVADLVRQHLRRRYANL